MEVFRARSLDDEGAKRRHEEGIRKMSGSQDSILPRPEVRQLLSWVIQGHEKIAPLPLKDNDRFPEVNKIIGDSMTAVPLLEELASYGLLHRIKAYSEPSCPNCGSTQIFDKYLCPLCEGQNLDKGQRIQHYACGHVDLKVRFNKDGKLICPKCGKELKLIGTDYQRIEDVFHCNDCHRDSSMPKVLQTCSICSTSYPHEKAELKPIFGYVFNEEKRTEVIANALVELPIVKLLKAQGYSISMPGTLKGRSGAEHLFDIVATRYEKSIVFAITTGPSERGPKPVLNFFAKTYDVPAEREVLIAIPRLSKDAKKLAETYGMEYMEGETAEEILKDMPMLFSEPRIPTLPVDQLIQREIIEEAPERSNRGQESGSTQPGTLQKYSHYPNQHKKEQAWISPLKQMRGVQARIRESLG